MSGNSEEVGLALVLEFFNEKGLAVVQPMLQSGSSNAILIRAFATVGSTLRERDRARTRLVVTGDMIASVETRDPRLEGKFTMDRGSGIVAAKTMPPDAHGVVDILLPAAWVLIDREQDSDGLANLVGHLVAHEAVHATMHHLGSEPFDVWRRREYDQAALQFASMASEQVEEHLAEYLSNKVAPNSETNVDQVRATFHAWEQTLSQELPAIAQDDPDYYYKGMLVSLNALHVLWKTLAYFAAELRDGNSYSPVPDEIASLSHWGQDVAQWWPGYTSLLARIPMSADIDVDATDQIVDELGQFLQDWAKAIGFDHHDTPQGAWFQVTRWS